MTRITFLGADQDYTDDLFNPLDFCPQYVLLGSFQIDRVTFEPAIEVAIPEAIYDHTPYMLYRVQAENQQQAGHRKCLTKGVTNQ